MIRAWFAVAVLLGGSMAWSGSPALDENESPGLEDLSWMIGHFRGQALGGDVEETWTRPAGGTMIGTFRLSKESETTVVEFLMMEETDEGIVYRFLHYTPQMKPWEKEAMVFRLVEFDGDRVVFERIAEQEGTPRRLIYSTPDDGELHVRVEGGELDESGNPSGFDVPMRMAAVRP